MIGIQLFSGYVITISALLTTLLFLAAFVMHFYDTMNRRKEGVSRWKVAKMYPRYAYNIFDWRELPIVFMNEYTRILLWCTLLGFMLVGVIEVLT